MSIDPRYLTEAKACTCIAAFFFFALRLVSNSNAKRDLASARRWRERQELRDRPVVQCPAPAVREWLDHRDRLGVK